MGGFFGDAAYTFKAGSVDKRTEKLLTVTEESLYLGIEQLVADNCVGDIGNAIQQHVEKNDFNVVRDLVGHGVGRKPHEDPQVPNYGQSRMGVKLRTGMVLAIEPMVNLGTRHVVQLNDGWTIQTADRKPSAHFEHDIVIGEHCGNRIHTTTDRLA